ncbi:MAG: DNA-binding response regulator [Planctomycetota bacterium]|nr:MAG: DNA-binding response regulator [Planctomycetota bacterium]
MNITGKILIIEDDPGIRRALVDNLTIQGHKVTSASQGKEGFELGMHETYDLILLDIMLPEMNGYDILEKWREDAIETPVLFLSAKGEEVDKVKGLELGADDYITKPFQLNELLARVKASLRRYKINTQRQDQGLTEFRWQNKKVDFESCITINGEKKYSISKREREILKILIANQGKSISRNEIIRYAWPDNEYPSTRTIDNLILSIRKKIEDVPSNPQHLISIHGIGYQFNP